MLYATLSLRDTAGKENESGTGLFVRAELPKCSHGPKSLVLSDDAIRCYFHQMDSEKTLSRTPVSAVPRLAEPELPAIRPLKFVLCLHAGIVSAPRELSRSPFVS